MSMNEEAAEGTERAGAEKGRGPPGELDRRAGREAGEDGADAVHHAHLAPSLPRGRFRVERGEERSPRPASDIP